MNRGVVLNKCQVECLIDTHCNSGEECLNNNCEEILPSCSHKCTESKCEGSIFIDCVQQDDGCYDWENKGRVLNRCDVQCTSDSHCSQGECIGYECIRSCPVVEVAKYCSGGSVYADYQNADCSSSTILIEVCDDMCADNSPHDAWCEAVE